MKNLLSLILFSLFILCSCNKPKTDEPYVPVARCPDMTRNMDTINLFIHGDWEWVESYKITREFQGYVTPNTQGENRRNLKLRGDSLQFFINNSPDSIYRFHIRLLSDLTGYPDDSLPIIDYVSRYTGMGGGIIPLKICKNQLLMQTQYTTSSGGESLWIRK
jgi:hypothetical protein